MHRAYGEDLRETFRTFADPVHVLAFADGAVVSNAHESIMIHRLPLTPPLRLSDPMSAEWRPGEVW